MKERTGVEFDVLPLKVLGEPGYSGRIYSCSPKALNVKPLKPKTLNPKGRWLVPRSNYL